MPLGLKRYQQEGDDHFVTFSCYRREPHFVTLLSKDTSSNPSNKPAAAIASRFSVM